MTRRYVFLALAVLATALLAGLGVWQVERRAWKLALIDRVERRLAAAPVAPPPRAAWRTIDDDSAYLRVRATGRWRAAAPVFVQAVTELGGGYWVLAPLDTAGGTILINRGFVPRGDRAAIRAPTGEATVTGLLRVSEPEGAFLRDNDPAADRWYSRDTDAIARARRLGAVAPYFIDADAGGATGWPRGGLTVVRFRNTHLIYALTWFTLAAMMAYLAYRIARAPRDA
ncbi:SURF1 family protein [Sphingomonas sp. BK235]|uniref:SURF1 family protein n=1 Tax=Sphingomonas sp. BK235 TaxID=2512131 RepID=UPI00105289DC|nr:SURF1 family protein [Sphingomonas sp. BK235]TCP37027.1 surfeit locus 1 family protein [Sphingomonas sp. BK235]